MTCPEMVKYVRYLGVEVDDALEIAERIEIQLGIAGSTVAVSCCHYHFQYYEAAKISSSIVNAD